MSHGYGTLMILTAFLLSSSRYFLIRKCDYLLHSRYQPIKMNVFNAHKNDATYLTEEKPHVRNTLVDTKMNC